MNKKKYLILIIAIINLFIVNTHLINDTKKPKNYLEYKETHLHFHNHLSTQHTHVHEPINFSTDFLLSLQSISTLFYMININTFDNKTKHYSYEPNFSLFKPPINFLILTL